MTKTWNPNDFDDHISSQASIKEIPFWYVRHGQTDWNVEDKAMGQTDIPLNFTGEQQAHLASKHLAGEKIATICHSPLSRAKKTAEILQGVLNCNLVEIEELREFNLGSYEGQKKEKWFQDWKSGIELPGTESYRAFIHRAVIGINKALSLSGPVLIVAHGGVYWAIEHALQLNQESGIQNCVPVFHESPKNQHEKWKIHNKVFK